LFDEESVEFWEKKVQIVVEVFGQIGQETETNNNLMFVIFEIDGLVVDLFVFIDLENGAQVENVFSDFEEEISNFKANELWVPGSDYIEKLENHGSFLLVAEVSQEELEQLADVEFKILVKNYFD
jgi:hypothetical protein